MAYYWGSCNDAQRQPEAGVFFVPEKKYQIETTVKKSRFIATVCPADSRHQALAALEQSRHEFADAGHHCWAYLIGSPSSPLTVAMSDDGEPSGTAGKPILNVLQHKEVGNIMIVVSRYFGGIKLGAGGLVRAYSGAAQAVMETMPVIKHVAKIRVCVSVDFSQEQNLRHWLSVHQGEMLATEYKERALCEITIPQLQHNALIQAANERHWLVLSDAVKFQQP